MRFYLENLGVLIDGQPQTVSGNGVDRVLEVGKEYLVTASVLPAAASTAISFSLLWDSNPDGFDFNVAPITSFGADVDVTVNEFPEQRRVYVALEAKGDFKFPTAGFDLVSFAFKVKEINNVFVISLTIVEK